MEDKKIKTQNAYVAFLAILLIWASAAFSQVDKNPQIASAQQSLDIISQGVSQTPFGRRDAVAIFQAGKDRKKLIEWVESNQIDVLGLTGTLQVGSQEFTVFLTDLSGYDADFESVLSKQLGIYHSDAIADMIVDLEARKEKSTSAVEKREINVSITDFKASQDTEILWTKADIVSNYTSLLNMSLNTNQIKSITVRMQNNAPVFDAYWQNQGKRRPLDDIKIRPKGTRSSVKVGLISESKDYLSAIKQYSSSFASSVLDFLITPVQAQATLCGPGVSGENFCPPDNNFEPDNESWYGYFYQLQNDPTYVRGYVHTGVQWSSTELRAFADVSAPHCQPILTGTSANCRTSLGALQEDVIYVPDSTYEAETAIDNPSCTFRTGINSIDVNNGCFVAYYALSQFPNPYLDTTLFDSSNVYNATIGTYTGAYLTAGPIYGNYIYFHAYNESAAALIGKRAEARGQIGTRIPAGCFSSLCVFGVDTSAVMNSSLIYPVIF